MERVIEVEDKFDLIEKLDLTHRVTCHWYAYDARTGWDTWIISTGEGVIGFTNGEL